jgi:hypothetical protein
VCIMPIFTIVMKLVYSGFLWWPNYKLTTMESYENLWLSHITKNLEVLLWPRWKHTTRGSRLLSHCIFLGVPCLNFNYVIIMKDFHNVFTYYGRSKPKEIKCTKIKLFNFIWYDVRVHLCRKRKSQCIKKWKYIHEIIEMIFNLYEICHVY